MIMLNISLNADAHRRGFVAFAVAG